MQMALDALTRIESMARSHADTLLSIARIAHTAIENIHASHVVEDAVEQQNEHHDSEGLGG